MDNTGEFKLDADEKRQAKHLVDLIRDAMFDVGDGSVVGRLRNGEGLTKSRIVEGLEDLHGRLLDAANVAGDLLESALAIEEVSS